MTILVFDNFDSIKLLDNFSCIRHFFKFDKTNPLGLMGISGKEMFTLMFPKASLSSLHISNGP